MEQAKCPCRTAMAGFGAAAEPDCRLGKVWRQLATFGIEVTNDRGCLGVAGNRGATLQRFTLDWIGLDCQALRQCHAPTCLAGPVTFFCRLAIELYGCRAIHRH